MMPDKSAVRSILIMNLGGIGDFLLSLPALNALRNHFPAAHIELVTIARTAELARAYPFCDEVIVLPEAMAERIVLLCSLRRKRYDLAINMRTMVSWISAVKIYCVFAAIGARATAGRNTNGRGWFFDYKTPETMPGDRPEFEYDLETVRTLGAAGDFSAISVPFSEGDQRFAEALLSQAGIAQQARLVAVNPSAPWPAKRWPIESFAAVINILSKDPALVFVVTGSREDAPLFTRLQELVSVRLVNGCGKTTVLQLAALLRRCRLFITNDTGSMHLAAALKVPLIAIFGGSHYKRFDPRYIWKEAVVFYKNKPCAPCDRAFCPDMRCLKEIDAREVAEAAVSLLENNREGRD